jgi:hypothetical protein
MMTLHENFAEAASAATNQKSRKHNAMKPKRTQSLLTTIVMLALFGAVAPSRAADKKPNIVVIMADDVGMWNISAYHHGMMGGRTPNIDRIAHEGALFSDYYAQQSCTAGRAAFILGQCPFRTKSACPGFTLVATASSEAAPS